MRTSIARLRTVVGLLLVMGCLVWTARVDAQGVLENPPANSFQSGIGVVSGWKCTAGIITLRFDGRIDVQAAYGTLRSDTKLVCNDDGNNGFGLLVNWNNLGPGVHTVEVLDNGQLFTSATVTVTTFGTDFIGGVSASCTVPDFPSPGNTATLEWQTNLQNFAIRSVTGRPTGSPPSVPPSGGQCCRVCTTGKPCGNSCINRQLTCHQPPGCAC